MPALTSDLQNDRRRFKRSNLLVGSIFFLCAALIVGAFFYSRNSDNQSESTAGSDNGVLPSSWLVKYFGHSNEFDLSVGGPGGDPDGDLLNNFEEFYFNTNPTNPDTDGDGQFDGAEVAFNSNPNGEGTIFSESQVSSAADRIIEENDIDALREGNIRESITNLLNPPPEEDVNLPLPEDGELNVTDDNSEQAIEKYFTEVVQIISEVNYSSQDVQNVMLTDSPAQSERAVGNIYTVVDQLRSLEVPRGVLTFHKIQVASFFTAANTLQMAAGLSLEVPLEEQGQAVQGLYYQLAVLDKARSLTSDSLQAMAGKFPSAFENLVVN